MGLFSRKLPETPEEQYRNQIEEKWQQDNAAVFIDRRDAELFDGCTADQAAQMYPTSERPEALKTLRGPSGRRKR
jgi:hypothetical protein